MRLEEYRQQIVATISQHIPALASCGARGGRFTLEEINRAGFRCPAVFVAILRVQSAKPVGDGHLILRPSCAAYIVTQNERGMERATAALNLAESLCILVENQRWGCPQVGKAGSIKAENLYDSGIDNRGVSFWAVTWDQDLQVGTSPWVDGQLPRDVYLGFAPDVGPEHIADYTRIGVGEEVPS